MLGLGGVALIAMLVVLGLVHGGAATTYSVSLPGTNGGWGFETSNVTYDEVFSKYQLFVGDYLNFTFDGNTHDVHEIPPADVAGCSSSRTIQQYLESVNVELKTAGQHGFICSVGDHCTSFGMHLLVTVSNRPPPGPPPTAGPNGAASFVRSGSAMLVGALIAVCAVLAL